MTDESREKDPNDGGGGHQVEWTNHATKEARGDLVLRLPHPRRMAGVWNDIFVFSEEMMTAEEKARRLIELGWVRREQRVSLIEEEVDDPLLRSEKPWLTTNLDLKISISNGGIFFMSSRWGPDVAEWVVLLLEERIFEAEKG